MKRRMLPVLLLFAALALALPALAEPGDGSLGDMVVVNCSEWVSLRAQPDTNSARLIQVPLGAKVTDCHAYDQRFVYCRYNGLAGYILAEYLRAADAAAPAAAWSLPEGNDADMGDAEAAARLPLDDWVDGIHVTAERSYGEGETLQVLAVNDAGYPLWSYKAYRPYVTELNGTAAFIGGTADDPRVIVYDDSGLVSLRLADGEKVWQLPVDLGGSLVCATAPNGMMYIGSYYGDSIVAFTIDGLVIWRTAADPELYWLYDLQLTEAGIVATYEHLPNGSEGTVTYGYDGSLLKTN